MLTMTETASTVVKTIAAESTEAADGGLRISATDPTAADFMVSIAPAPEATDTVLERDGARVFLEQNAAVALDDKVLDAQVDTEGSIRFAITNQVA